MSVRPISVRRASAASIPFATIWRCVGLERGRARLDAKPLKKFALRERAVRTHTHAFGRVPERFKVDVRGQIDDPRRDQRIGISVFAHRLQGFAQPALRVAVVDHQAPPRDRARSAG